MSEQVKFQVGDTVTWTSQAGGNAKTKTGKVVMAVPAKMMLSEILGGFWATWTIKDNLLRERNHESYLIQVGKSKRLYWPLVKYLEKVQVIEAGKDVYSSGISPLQKYKLETESWNADLEDDDSIREGD